MSLHFSDFPMRASFDVLRSNRRVMSCAAVNVKEAQKLTEEIVNRRDLDPTIQVRASKILKKSSRKSDFVSCLAKTKKSLVLNSVLPSDGAKPSKMNQEGVLFALPNIHRYNRHAGLISTNF